MSESLVIKYTDKAVDTLLFIFLILCILPTTPITVPFLVLNKLVEWLHWDVFPWLEDKVATFIGDPFLGPVLAFVDKGMKTSYFPVNRRRAFALRAKDELWD